ncbi:protein-L-isoaspartate O-methyltransferase, partial [Stenotrophomonas maltophilia]
MTIRTIDDECRAGRPVHGPFAASVVTGAEPALVVELVWQLAVGGRLVARVGGQGGQSLVQLERWAEGRLDRGVRARGGGVGVV